MTEVAARAAFNAVRYAQVWEDADVLLQALAIRPGSTCLSIASAGDNALALLTADPARVVAVDLNPAQLACARLRTAAFRTLDHDDLLGLIGSRPAADRHALLARCAPGLDDETRAFWEASPGEVAGGIGSAGKFERFFRTFRTQILPLVHGRRTTAALLAGSPDRAARERFHRERWDTLRWRLLFRIFFSRFVMGRLGRDPAFFRYVEGSVADRILGRVRHALVELDPADNPYLHWILTGTHGTALPAALRRENHGAIRGRIDRIEWRLGTLEEVLASLPPASVHAFNLSDIFEYMSDDAYRALLLAILRTAAPGARLAYWNMLVPRSRPADLAGSLRPLDELAGRLHRADRAFFYSRFVVEQVIQPHGHA